MPRDHRKGPDDDRQDKSMRDRLDELVQFWDDAVARLDRRYRRVAGAALGSIVITLAAVVLGYLILQGQRWEATRDGCERTNQQAEATIGLLNDLDVRESVIVVAQRRYPHVPPLAPANKGEPAYTGPLTCEEDADRKVGGLKL